MNRLLANRSLWRAGFVLYALLLFILTHWPRLNPPGAEAGSDKLAHFLAFFLWTALAIAAGLFGRWNSRRNILLATLLAIAYGILDETSQIIPAFERQFSFLDMAANAAGTALASALAMMVIRPFTDSDDS